MTVASIRKTAAKRFSEYLLALERLESRMLLSATVFESHEISPSSYRGAATVADLDGDSDVDVITSAYIDGTIFWHKNDGKGNFGAPISISAKSQGIHFARPVDIDIDQDFDLLAATKYIPSGRVEWYENRDGKGTFSEPRVIASDPGTAWNVLTGDFDGDSDVDLITGFSVYPETRINLLLNVDGKGTFVKGQELDHFGGYPILTDAADMDGDGDIDFLTSYNYPIGDSPDSTMIAWYENTGHRSFAPRQPIIRELGFISAVQVTNLDGDSLLDIATASGNTGRLSWHAQSGKGRFSEPKIIARSMQGVGRINASDWDGDGDIDLATGGFSLDVFVNRDGKGMFDSGRFVDNDVYGGSSIHAADFDGDSDVDLLAEAGINLNWYRNVDRGGTFERRSVFAPTSFAIEAALAVDFDSDGDMDLLNSSKQNFGRPAEIVWQENSGGKGEFVGPKKLVDAGGSNLGWLGVSDLDGDRLLDLLAIVDSKLYWYPRTNNPEPFGKPIPLATRAFHAHTNDLDADGDQDVLVAFGESVVLYRNVDGRGTFQSFVIDDEADEIYSNVVSADFDRDGDPDVVAADFRGLAYFRNDGAGQFPRKVVFPGFELEVFSVVPIDLDGDNDLDLAISSRTSGLAWRENLDGQGTFGGPRIVLEDAVLPSSGSRVFAGDLDGDLDPDLASFELDTRINGYVTDVIMWFENVDGRGNFTSGQLVGRRSFSSVKLLGIDVDRDGKTDLVSVFGDGRMEWHERRVLGDVNGDGRFDSTDLVLAWQAGHYEDGISGNASFNTGDWNADGEFDTRDLVLAFQNWRETD
jgi:hypothetical protein